MSEDRLLDEYLTDVSTTESLRANAECIDYEPGKVLHALAQVEADEIRVKVGRLEIIADPVPGKAMAFFRTRVLLDGKPFGVTSLKLEGNVGGLWKCLIGFFPSQVNDG